MRLANRYVLFAALAVALVGCRAQKKPDPPFGIAQTTPEGGALAAWFDGERESATEQAKVAGENATALFTKGELASASGDIEAAYDHWVALLRDHPGHPLTRTAAARLYASRDEIVDFEDRIWPVFGDLGYARLEPLTRVYVSLLHQTIAYRRWKRSESTEPFVSDGFGFPARWLKTPLVSPWRLRDFDRRFPMETANAFDEEYLSPYTATDVETNREDVEPYWTSGITIYPSFGNTGIHYLETFATLDGAAPREFLLYGNFVSAAKVWIDGELVFDRREGDYQTGKLLRRVELAPGKHRILVKMAYQSGYRDWFDLVFIPQGAAATDDSDLEFRYACVDARELPGCIERPSELADVRVKSKSMRPADLEPIIVATDKASRATDVGLWITMINSYYDGEHEHFRAAWEELQARRPNFAAGWDLWGDEVQTLWQVPSKLRDSRALQAVRKAYELDPDSVAYQTRLGAWLTQKGEEREARELLEQATTNAYDGERLRTYKPLAAWAAYLDSKNWKAEAEKAWTNVLAADPSNCRAAEELQTLLYGRSDYRKPSELMEDHEECPDLWERWVRVSETNIKDRLKIARRNAGRNPLRGDFARSYARELWQSGAGDEAMKVLTEARAVNPDSSSIASELADRAYAAGDTTKALAILDGFADDYGNSGWLVWKKAKMTGEIPLTDLMPDGLQAAKDAVEEGATKSLSNDEAYFVVDFAARRYFPDGSRLTLTHTVVRVMTKGAIDRYGEQSLPGGSRALLARTIKQDGSVRVPEETAGKSTLSMPGLAEGDFVEMAYIEYDGPDSPPHHIEGVRFFFRMSNISTLHSEYVVLGDIADFIRENDAPEIERFTHEGLPAVRFLARDNPRPRTEQRATSIEEYLPWVQMYRRGSTISDIEKMRRDIAESIADSSKTSVAFENQLREWTKGELGEPGSKEWLKTIFYRVTGFVPEPTISPRSFNTDVNHAILQKEGNSMLILKSVLDRFEIPNDVFLIKSKYAVPKEYPIREDNKYSHVLLRVTSPQTGDEYWLTPDGPDAMFNAVGPALTGQPAICATCEEPEKTEIPRTGVRQTAQSVDAVGKVDAAGNLTGRLTFTFEGESAASIRSGLRRRADETSRSKFVDALASGTFAGSSATAYDIQTELQPDEPLVIVVDFRRDGFARDVGGAHQIETRLFRNGIASVFGGLPERKTPMMVGFALDHTYSLELDLSAWKSAKLVSPAGERTFDSKFGNARRVTEIDGDTLRISANAQMPIQRVPVSDYQAFQKWGLEVEQSSVLLVRLQK